MYTKQDIFDKLREVKEELAQKYNVYYIALYGSQNYWIDTATSDIDFKAIILPTLDDLVSKKQPESRVIEYSWWQVEVKDIRNYVDSAVKVNVNFIELLSTEYYISDYDCTYFRSFFKRLLDEQWIIYLRWCYGMMQQKIHALRHPFPSKLGTIAKFWYDPKQLGHIIRLRTLMERYIKWDYSFKHEWEERDELIKLKSGEIPDKEVDLIVASNDSCAKFLVDNYTTEAKFDAKYKLIEFSQEIIKQSIIKSIWNK